MYKGTGIFKYIRATRDAHDEEAWLVVPDEHVRTTWHRKDGTLIRPWEGPSVDSHLRLIDLIEVPFIGAAIGTPFLDAHLLVDEGL